MTWDALEHWGDDVTRLEPLTGGVANDVWSVRIDGRLAVARLGRRSDADLGWETSLLQHLDRHGITVPAPIPTRDGRLFVDGLVVMQYVEGGPPETEDDWRRVAASAPTGLTTRCRVETQRSLVQRAIRSPILTMKAPGTGGTSRQAPSGVKICRPPDPACGRRMVRLP